ncbi:hypothetical protein BH10PLA2_BH10PLA2_18590 [soil metagenome]
MISCPTRHLLTDLLADALTPEEELDLNVHLQACPDCRQLLEQLTESSTQNPVLVHARQREKQSETDPTFNRFMDFFLGERGRAWLEFDALDAGGALPGQGNETTDRQARLPSVAGYKLLGELGRGASGVVYLALHLRLERQVAVKILHARASQESLVRFRQEAATLAKLQHPNIVQVYDIDEVDGQPYFAMEYVAGGNLAARINNRPQDAREAARLVQMLANAMESIHRKGIVHRDLKPGNILLQDDAAFTRATPPDSQRATDSPPGKSIADPIPKISDFGLAKHLSGAANLTESSDFLGTPGYMAPEQARGARASIGPATDVYALGVILYELLTGRPPFRGDAPVDTLLQVAFDEPTPPRIHQTNLPRDIETICLKCLRKDPANRYATAADLAADLKRFLSGRPIKARRVGVVERALSWCRRNQTAAFFLGLVVVLLTTMGILGPFIAYHEHSLRQQAEENAASAQASAVVAQAEKERADQNLALARKATQETLVKIAQNQALRSAQFLTLREDLLLLLVENATELSKLPVFDPVTEAWRGRALLQLAYVQKELGKAKEAMEELREAVRIFIRLSNEYPKTVLYQRYLAACQNDLGVHIKRGGKPNDLKEAEPHLRASKEGWSQLLAGSPDSSDYQQGLADALNNYAGICRRLGRPAEAIACFTEAIKLFSQVADANPAEPRFRSRVAIVRSNLATHLTDDHRLGEAAQEFQSAQKIYEQLLAKDPMNVDWAAGMAHAGSNFAICKREQGKYLEAIAACTQCIDILKPILAKEPRLISAREPMILAYKIRAENLMELNRLPEALADWDADLKLAEGEKRFAARAGRALTLARLKRLPEALAEVDHLAKQPEFKGRPQLDCAGVWGLAAEALQPKETPREQYLAKAWEAIQQVVKTGELEPADLISYMKTGADLASLRPKPEFAKLLQSLEKTATPTTPPAKP